MEVTLIVLGKKIKFLQREVIWTGFHQANQIIKVLSKETI